ncbi:MAG: hypothetical protein RJA22_1857 [Verrucomicrobiota bacterium]
MKPSPALLLAAAAALLGLSPLPTAGQATPPPAAGRTSLESLFDETLLARGKGVRVTSSHLERAFIAYSATAASRGQRVTEESRPRQEAELLDRIIVTQVLTNRASRADATNAEARAAKYIADAIQAAGGETALQRQLLATGTRLAQFRERAHEEALADVVLDRELRSGLSVPEAQVTEFHRSGTDFLVVGLEANLEKLVKDPAAKPAQVAALRARIDAVRKANLARLEQPERVRIAHIFQATRDRQANQDYSDEQKRIKRQFMEKLRTRAQGGEDFAKLVQTFSEDPNLAETKGEYTLTRNSPFSPEFKSAAFSLPAGQVSDLVITPFGIHIIKVLEKLPPRKADYDKVAGELRDFLLTQRVQQEMPAYFTRIKREAAVEILDERFRELLGRNDLGPDATLPAPGTPPSPGR